MAQVSLEEFADRINEILPVVIKEFMRHQTSGFYKLKVTLPQFVILDLLNRTGGTKMSDLSRNMNVTTAAMTGIVDRLVRDGYAVRESDPKDRRIIKVRATAKGARTVKDINLHRREMIVRVFGKLKQADREDYLRILTNIRDHLK